MSLKLMQFESLGAVSSLYVVTMAILYRLRDIASWSKIAKLLRKPLFTR